jgi:hypothetical protein
MRRQKSVRGLDGLRWEWLIMREMRSIRCPSPEASSSNVSPARDRTVGGGETYLSPTASRSVAARDWLHTRAACGRLAVAGP